jgi:hypothetical protein
MEHKKLNQETNYDYVDMTLYLQEVKMLYNACVDIINRQPMMLGYKETAKKLLMVIEEQENKTNRYGTKDNHRKSI